MSVHDKFSWLVVLLAASVLLGCTSVRALEASVQTGTIPPLAPLAGKAAANGVTLAYERFGPTDRQTVLLIPGTGMQLIDWPDELIEELVAEGYHVIRFDNRDVGLSTRFDEAGLPDWEAITAAMEAGEPPPVAYTLEDMAADAVGLLDAFGIEQAHIVGVSMGGGIAQLVAADYPERTLSLTSFMADSGNPELPLVADPDALEVIPPPPAPGDVEAYIDYRVQVFLALASPDYPVEEAQAREWVREAVDRAYYPAGIARHEAVATIAHYTDRRTKLRSIQVPTVVLHGADDALVPFESAWDIAENIPGAELRVLFGLGHDIPVALAPKFADAILDAAARAGRAQ